MITELASLDNVLFWHKFANRGSEGFAINACFMNHYPDFLLVLKSGKKIIVEFKGSQLAGYESAKKAKLGHKWAEQSGREFRYFMVFKDKKIEDCETIQSAKNIIVEL